ncbi:MAG: hypothetical protein AAGG38_11845 [Planctomycetota bacterium]
MRKPLVITVISLNVWVMTLSMCILSAVWMNGFNPMQAAFITRIQIHNTTSEKIKVTPIGAIGPAADRIPLPIFTDNEVPLRLSRQRGGFVVEAGASLDIFYDWDDVNLSEIVVEDPRRQLTAIIVDPHPESNQYRPPEPDSFTFGDGTAPQVTNPAVLSAFRSAQHPRWPWPLYAAWATLLLSILFLYLLPRRRRQTQDE